MVIVSIILPEKDLDTSCRLRIEASNDILLEDIEETLAEYFNLNSDQECCLALPGSCSFLSKKLTVAEVESKI